MSATSSATVRLHQTLYTEAAIADASATFADFASFDVHRDGDHFVVDVTNIEGDVEGDVVAEFCNFALANTANARKSEES